jgi:hypothetical protein
MAAPTTSEVLRLCYLGDGRGSLASRIAVVAAWCVTLVVLLFNALFPVLMEDGNLLIRAVCTLILSAPLLLLYVRAKRSMRDRPIRAVAL